MKKIDINKAFLEVPFWLQFIIWLFSIIVTSKIFEVFFRDNFVNQILKIIVGFVIGLTIIIFISKRIPKK